MRLSSLFDRMREPAIPDPYTPRPSWPVEASRPPVPLVVPPFGTALDGPQTWRDVDGRLVAAWHVLRGQLHGPWVCRHPDGSRSAEGEFHQGFLHRAYQRRSPAGRVLLEGEFVHGRPVGDWSWVDDLGRVRYQGAWIPELRAAIDPPAVRAGLRPDEA